MSLLSEIWGVLTPGQRRRVLWAQALSIVMAFSTVIGIAPIAPFFAVLGDPALIDRSRPLRLIYVQLGFSSVHSFVIALGCGFIAMVLTANAINIAGLFAMIRLSYGISTELQSTLFAEYLGRPYVFHVRTNSAVVFNNVVHETNRMANSVLQSAFPLVTNILTAVLIIGSVIWLNPMLGAAIVLALGGGYALIYFALRNWLLRSGEIQSRLLIEQTKVLNESLGAIKEVLVLRAQNYFRGNFERSSATLARTSASGQLVFQSPKYLMECVTVVGLVLIALLSGRGEAGLGSWLGQLTFVGFAAYRLLPMLQQAFAALVRIRGESAAFAAIAPDLRLARARKVFPTAIDSGWTERPQREICLKGVSFSYEPGRPNAVNDVTLRIPARAAIGLVGANGSGKTTTVDLVAGLLAPAAGRLEVDGIAIDEANRAAWQSRIAYVPQTIFLLDTTIAQNIALGVAAAAIDRERLVMAAQLAQLDGFVATLPAGYEHPIGERGARLSGGQRQRIGIARALYANASVLIMDEATNALDGLTEQELLATVLRLRGRYTVILIAHRMSSVQACDLIFEFNRGRVTASGSYPQLLQDSTSFRQLAETR
jgi:ABC-type bacteriocin/lantibiotic exporter with double-glycine peptidase domain